MSYLGSYSNIKGFIKVTFEFPFPVIQHKSYLLWNPLKYIATLGFLVFLHLLSLFIYLYYVSDVCVCVKASVSCCINVKLHLNVYKSCQISRYWKYIFLFQYHYTSPKQCIKLIDMHTSHDFRGGLSLFTLHWVCLVRFSATFQMAKMLLDAPVSAVFTPLHHLLNEQLMLCHKQ